MTDVLRAAVAAALPSGLADLAELVAIPSVFDPDGPGRAAVETSAERVRLALSDLGLEARVQPVPDGSFAVIASAPAPAGAPTVLLYAHHDVQPAGDPDAWGSDPWTLTPRADGRLYGRGAADCKGGVVAHLVALRALRAVASASGSGPGPGHGLGSAFPVGVRVVVEGSEERGGGGLEDHLAAHGDEFADVDVAVVLDAGNAAVGEPAVVTALRGTAIVHVAVRALHAPVHSGMFGGAAPDALQTLVTLLASLRSADGDTAVDGLDGRATWDGLPYDADRFAVDAGLLPGAVPVGSADPASQVWARPAVTIMGIDAPAVAGSAPVIQAHAAAALNLRVAPGVDPSAAGELLVAHLERRAPAGVVVTASVEGVGRGFAARAGEHTAAFRTALSEAYDGAPVGSLGGGGSIPLCATIEDAIPGVEIVLAGVSEPAARVHGPDESVDPREIERMALAEALFLSRLAPTRD